MNKNNKRRSSNVNLKIRCTPSCKKSKTGATLAIENAERHYQCAIHLSSIGVFGSAQSHLILGVEEVIKFVFLYLKGLGIPLRQNLLNELLFRHKPRHEVGGGLHIIFILLFWAIDTLKNTIEKAVDKTPAGIIQMRNQAVQKIIMELQKSASSDSIDSEIDRMVTPVINWWETADKMKENGFYVDFQNGNWISPQLVKKEDYLQSLKITSDVIENIKKGFQIIESLPDAERIKMVREMKQQYKQALKSYKAKNAQKAN